jgi:hypothetical protein
MFCPVFIDHEPGRFFSLHNPCPEGPRNCGQSSLNALATSCQWHSKHPSNINLIRMIVINRDLQMTLALNRTSRPAE